SIRAAEFIANRYAGWSVSRDAVKQAAAQAVGSLQAWIAKCAGAGTTWQADRDAFQSRMTRAGAHIRSLKELSKAVEEAWAQFEQLENEGCSYETPAELAEALRNRQLCFAHAVYLEAILFALRSGVGSRGSCIVLDPEGERVHDKLDEQWRIAPEDSSFREQVLETVVTPGGEVVNEWVPRRPIPEADAWFETAWASFRSGEIFDTGTAIF
ncbi:MAG: hypothetical protein JW918_08395, partial [Anaerolineae bacterium]|nr:hypothetical protein [Anaerolineae bacterium]